MLALEAEGLAEMSWIPGPQQTLAAFTGQRAALLPYEAHCRIGKARLDASLGSCLAATGQELRSVPQSDSKSVQSTLNLVPILTSTLQHSTTATRGLPHTSYESSFDSNPTAAMDTIKQVRSAPQSAATATVPAVRRPNPTASCTSLGLAFRDVFLPLFFCYRRPVC
jgi:hypothetical protein